MEYYPAYHEKKSVRCILKTALVKTGASTVASRNGLADSGKTGDHILPACFGLGLEVVPHDVVLEVLLYL